MRKWWPLLGLMLGGAISTFAQTIPPVGSGTPVVSLSGGSTFGSSVMVVGSGLTIGAPSDGFLGFTGRTFMVAPADGVVTFQNNAGTQGLRMQFGNVPTINSAFGTSPSVVAGSTDTAFSVNVGTGGAATSGVVGFANTWPSAPRCIAQDTTTVGAGVQKVTTSTTLATITTATAWTASDIVNVICFGFRS